MKKSRHTRSLSLALNNNDKSRRKIEATPNDEVT